MIPATRDIEIYQGDSYQMMFRLKVTGSDPAQYIDLTGWVPKAQIRQSEGNPTVLAEFTATLADQSLFPGRVILTLTPTQTAALTADGVWDVQLTNAGATEVDTYMKGAVRLHLQVTR